MTEKLTAAEIERLRPANPRTGMGRHVHEDTLAKLCDMASASLPPAGDGEVEELTRDLRNLHRGYDAVVAAAIGRKAADTLARQQAEIARLRERVEKAEADGRLQADDRVLLNARVAELTRVVEELFGTALNEMASQNLPLEWQPDCALGRAAKALYGTADYKIALERYRADQALTAAQGEEPAADHTAAIREAIKALETARAFVSESRDPGFSADILAEIDAGRAKLTEIIEGGGDA